MAKTKIAIKLPDVLVELGRAVEVKGTHVHYSFPKKDRVILCATPDGKTLFCLKKTAANVRSADLETSAGKKRSTIEKSAALFEKWSDFEADQAEPIKRVTGFLHRVDRCHYIVYESDKWEGKKNQYIHEFKKPPVMWVNNLTAPTVLKLSGGDIRTTAKGITG